MCMCVYMYVCVCVCGCAAADETSVWRFQTSSWLSATVVDTVSTRHLCTSADYDATNQQSQRRQVIGYHLLISIIILVYMHVLCESINSIIKSATEIFVARVGRGSCRLYSYRWSPADFLVECRNRRRQVQVLVVWFYCVNWVLYFLISVFFSNSSRCHIVVVSRNV